MPNHEENPHAHPHVWFGIGLMMVNAIFFALMSNGVRYLTAFYEPSQIVFIRNIVSFLLLSACIPWHGTGALKTNRLPRHLLRSLVLLCSMTCWFTSISLIPLPQAVSLTYTTPLFLTLFAVIFLGEKIRWRRITAVIMGFFGVLVVVRPGFSTIGWEVIVPLCASLCAATNIYMVKPLTKTETPFAIVWYLTFGMVFLSAVPGLMVWREVADFHHMLAFALVGLCSTVVQYCLAAAFARCEITLLLPFDFVRLILTAGLANLAFGDRLDLWSGIGALIILLSTVYIAHRESQEARRHRKKGKSHDAAFPV